MFQMSGDKGISAFPDGDNLFRWKGTIVGPDETVKWILILKSQIYSHVVFYVLWDG